MSVFRKKLEKIMEIFEKIIYGNLKKKLGRCFERIQKKIKEKIVGTFEKIIYRDNSKKLIIEIILKKLC